MVEDRRAAPRQEAYLSAALETSQGESTIAITLDISSTGLMLLTRVSLEVGEVVKLMIVLGDAQQPLSGKVVRSERMAPHELWRYRVALAVEPADPVLTQLQAMLAAPPPPPPE